MIHGFQIPFCGKTWRAALFFSLAGFILQPSAFAGLPQPMVVYYGQAKDGYGWPYTKDATVILLSGTNECTRHNIAGSLSPGVNFALYAPLDDSRDTNRYVRNAVRTGEVVSIVVQDRYGQKTILESNAVPAVTKPGDILLINVTAGTDSDGDGLPDEWEQEMLDWGSNPSVTSILDIARAGDYDGDGQSNGDEYGAGTFAFLDYDFFFAEQLESTTNGRLRIEWLSIPAKVYNVQCSSNLPAGIWEDCEYSLTETGALQTGPAEGNGDWFSFYVPVLERTRAFRLTVK
jgi:hypothetical protein